MLNFYPGFVDNTNFRYIDIDGKYIATICITKYPKKMNFLEFSKDLPKDIQFEMSIFIQKQDTMKILKELTYNISSSKAEINTINNNQIDVDILDKLTSDAKKLRYEIQINNEQVYHTYIYISMKSDSKNDILYTVKKIRSILYSKMLISNVLNFRHLQGYLSTLPLNILDGSISKPSCTNMTTSNVANIFPFCTDTVFDKCGVVFGYTAITKKICNIDIFNVKYTNSNICIFGSSGSGKSYFAKLLILRQNMTNIKQYIFDPEGEYINIVSQVGGEHVSFNNKASSYINILDISETDVIETNFLNKKINLVYEFLNKAINIEPNCKEYILKAIEKSYKDKGIDNNITNMYIVSNNDKIYLNKTIKGAAYMPILSEVYENLKFYAPNDNKTLKQLIYSFEQILIDYSFLNNTTTLDFNNGLIVFSLSGLDAKMSNIMFEFLIEKIMNKIRHASEKSVIYIDEVWKFIYNNICSAEHIFTLFKTIRKLDAGIVTITQDVSDFLSKDLGIYGKSIINNSFIKVFFKMEYSDSELLSKIGILNLNEVNEITRLNKGSMIMLFQSNIINLDVKSNEYEDKIIRGDKT
jgi:type IV secretory pathway VirB4 component